MLKRIRIPSCWHNRGDEETMAHTQHGVADFKLGLGPCGKVVDSLALDFARDCVMVTQRTECGEVKRFTYLFAQITGRIEETY
jgi:hypothetical protein